MGNYQSKILTLGKQLLIERYADTEDIVIIMK